MTTEVHETPVSSAAVDVVTSDALTTPGLKWYRYRKEWRSSVAYITFVVALGTFLDTMNFSLVITVFPFRLEALQYHDVAGLVGWLLFIYAGGLVFSTPLVAMTSERMGTRRGVLIAGQILLLASQLLLMEAPKFWVMCIGRLLEGVSTAVILSIGLALVCDVTPEKDIGGQLGLAMIGLPLGSLVGPPIGGALYARWGYRAPFIFAAIITVFEFVARVLVVEKRATSQSPRFDSKEQSQRQDQQSPDGAADTQPSSLAQGEKRDTLSETQAAVYAPQDGASKELSRVGVVLQLITNVRSFIALLVVLLCTLSFSALEVVLPLHLQATWGLNSTKVGLVFLAATLPTLISSPLAGKLSDIFSPEAISALFLLLGIPWWAVLTLHFSLAFFIVTYAVENFFIAAVASPITAELASVTRAMKGVGYAHTYGAFNILYGLGTTFGSLIGAQIYGHTHNGWVVVIFASLGILIFCLGSVVALSGERPILRRGRGWIRRGSTA